MVLHSFDLRFKDKLLADYIESVASLILRSFFEIFPHFHVLLLQELNVLVGSLLIIEE